MLSGPMAYVLIFGLTLTVLITFANSFPSNWTRQNFGPDLDPNYLIDGITVRKNFSEMLILKHNNN